MAKPGDMADAVQAAKDQVDKDATDPDEQDKPDGTGAPEAADKSSKSDPSSTGAGDDVDTDDADVPSEYMGRDLSGLPADQRREFIAEWSGRDKLINVLQRENADLKKTKTADDAPAGKPDESSKPDEYTDEQLVEAMGLDMEDSYDAKLARIAVPLWRENFALKAQVDTTSKSAAELAEERLWTRELDRLEKRYGELPVSRADLVDQAGERRILDPEAAYWWAKGPIMSGMEDDLQTRLKAATKAGKKSATTPRPRSSGDVEDTIELESKTTRAAFKEAAKKASDKLGFDWGDSAREAFNPK